MMRVLAWIGLHGIYTDAMHGWSCAYLTNIAEQARLASAFIMIYLQDNGKDTLDIMQHIEAREEPIDTKSNV